MKKKIKIGDIVHITDAINTNHYYVLVKLDKRDAKSIEYGSREINNSYIGTIFKNRADRFIGLSNKHSHIFVIIPEYSTYFMRIRYTRDHKYKFNTETINNIVKTLYNKLSELDIKQLKRLSDEK